MSLATPEAFAQDPGTVWEFYHWRRDLVARAEPNPAHHALARLAGLVPRFTLITQNVDRLHHRAGSPGVIELHGNLVDARCTGCGRTSNHSGETLPWLPICDACGKLLRPAVVWFGEALPPDAWNEAEQAVREAEVLLVVGTSAVVHPAAGLATLAHRLGHRVIEVNPDPTPLTSEVDLNLPGPAGTILPEVVAAIASRGS
jgi:NAD-dependent deacetylase